MEVTAREFLAKLAELPPPVGMGKVFALAKDCMLRYSIEKLDPAVRRSYLTR